MRLALEKRGRGRGGRREERSSSCARNDPHGEGGKKEESLGEGKRRILLFYLHQVRGRKYRGKRREQ